MTTVNSGKDEAMESHKTSLLFHDTEKDRLPNDMSALNQATPTAKCSGIEEFNTGSNRNYRKCESSTKGSIDNSAQLIVLKEISNTNTYDGNKCDFVNCKEIDYTRNNRAQSYSTMELLTQPNSPDQILSDATEKNAPIFHEISAAEVFNPNRDESEVTAKKSCDGGSTSFVGKTIADTTPRKNSNESENESESSDDDSTDPYDYYNNDSESFARRMARNEKRNEELNRRYGGLVRTTTKKEDSSKKTRQPTGMLFAPPPITRNFPHREKEMKTLKSLLACWKQYEKVIPSPIFITGPSGTGKTAIVRSVLKGMKVRKSFIDGREVGTKSPHLVWPEVLANAAEEMMFETNTNVDETNNNVDELYSSETEDEEEDDGTDIDDEEDAVEAFRRMNTAAKRKRRIQGTLPVLHFGQALPKNIFFVLIIDHAERLLEKGHNDSLTQLLLLPKELCIRLSIIVITQHCLFADTRVNTKYDIVMFPATKKELIQPINIHFDAYRGFETFYDILSLPHFSSKILPPNPTPKDSQLYNSMITLLVHTLIPYTRDVREMYRLARIFYSTYIHLSPEGARSHVQKLLDLLFLPTKTHPVPTSTLPVHTQYLLLSCYLCQQNHPRTDIPLYTNSRSKKKNIKQENSASSFPVERLLSSFSIIMKRHCHSTIDSNLLFQEVRALMELGFVKEEGSHGEISCLVNQREVEGIAKELGFPLDKYLV